MKRHDRFLTWIAANAMGMALGFLTFLEVLNFLAFGFDFSLHWSEEALEGLENPEPLLRLGLGIGLPLAGALLAACQAWVLRGYLPRLWPWILCGPAGFLVPILVIWPLREIWGHIPGPVEPFAVVGGGMLGAGILQWLLLRRRGVDATRWLVLSMVGLPLGMVVFMGVVGAARLVVGAWPPWPLVIFLIGAFIGGTAGAVSGNVLLRRLSSQTEPTASGSPRD